MAVHNKIEAPPREELQRLYVEEGLRLTEVGKRFGVSVAPVIRWLKEYELGPRTVREARLAAVGKTVYSPEALAAKRARMAAMRVQITPESRAKQAEKMKGRVAHNKGKPASEETKAKLRAVWDQPGFREAMGSRQRGPLSPNWKGGVKSELNRRLDTAEWRRIRAVVYERDNWTCQDCGCKCWNTRDSKKDGRKKIQAHHIIARRDGGNDELENLVTLCMSCHHRREMNFKKKRVGVDRALAAE